MKEAKKNYKTPNSYNSDKEVAKEIASGGADSILAILFRDILTVCRLDHGKLSWLMERFLSDRRNGIPQNVKDRASARGNIRKEIFGESISWKVLFKALRFINVSKFQVTLTLYHDNGKTTTHGTKIINLGDPIYYDGTNLEPYEETDNESANG